MINRIAFASLAAAIGFAIAPCSAPTALGAGNPATGGREIMPFDADWRFNLGDDPAARQATFDDSKWRVLSVPHDWSIEGSMARPPEGEGQGGFFPHGIGWYRKSFTLPAAPGRKVVIEFDGVYMNSEVWINGQFLGRRPYGFVGFRYDLTEYLKNDGTPNVLAVRVDDSLEPALRWYAGAGIYRHVRLITTSYTHFRLDGGIIITTPEISANQAIVEATAIIDAHFFDMAERSTWRGNSSTNRPANREAVLRSSVLGPDGSVVASTESKISLEEMHPGQRFTQRVAVPNPRLWSDRTPELYRLRSTLEMGGIAQDETTTTFGIRSVKFEPDRGLFVNGQPVKLKGVCVHQDAGSFGNAVPAAVWAMRLAELKEMGCNAVRTSHHPFAPEFYDLCDQMGIYVFDEAFDEWTRGWQYNDNEEPRGKAQYGYHLYFNQWHDTDIRALLRRDRDHACVILWSIGNEIPNQLEPEGYKIAHELVAICHEEDPNRPATSACDRSAIASRNGFMDELDISGYNYIDRLYGTNTYVPEHARFPHRLMFGTETTINMANWLGVRDNDYVIGEFIWTGIDYLGEAGLPRRGSSAGLIDIAGGKKGGFYQRAAYWREDPVLQMLVGSAAGAGGPRAGGPAGGAPANAAPGRDGRGGGGGRGGGPSIGSWSGTADSPMSVRVVANCDEAELFLNNQSLGKHAVSHDTCFSEWTVPYAPGVLSVVGYRGGKEVASQKIATPGAAAQLHITQIKTPFADDLAFFEITSQDSAGLPVFGATNAVTVKVEGAGRLIGLDTGDLNYPGIFKAYTRQLYQGRALLTAQRSAPSGEIRITVTAPGLQTGNLSVDANRVAISTGGR